MMNEIICADCIEVLKGMKDDSVDLVITSPPYFRQRKYQPGKAEEVGTEKTDSGYIHNIVHVFYHCMRVCKPTGNVVFNVGDVYVDGSLQLIPYQFARKAIQMYGGNGLKLINEITWVKTNPTPRQYKRRLVSATEPFFHFVKSKDYYYDRDSFLKKDGEIDNGWTPKKGDGYGIQIEKSNLSPEEKLNAYKALLIAKQDLFDGKITDFRIKIRGIHKKAFGGQSGGRNSQIEKNGFTVIRMYGNKLKRDVIESPVANSKKINHPAIFPLKVITELVQLLSPEGATVLDPFCGSGQTCIVAQRCNRNYVGIDLSKKYCNIAIKRLKDDLNN